MASLKWRDQRWRVTLLIWVALLASHRARAEVVEVTLLADDSYPPYSYSENHEAQGIYKDIINEAGRLMPDYRISIIALPWKRGLMLIEDGKAFAIYPPYKHPEDRPYMNPYSEPLLSERVSVFCRPEVFLSHPRHVWPDDYYGLKFANNLGFSIGGEKFYQALTNNLLTMREYAGTRKSLMALWVGEVDCYMNGDFSIRWELAQMNKDESIRRSGFTLRLEEGSVISEQQGYLGYTDRDKGQYPFKRDFIEQFDQAVRTIKQEGKIQAIEQKYKKLLGE